MRFGFLIALIALLVVLALGSGGSIGDKLHSDGGLVLEQPSLAALAATTEREGKGVNFLEQEAGIAAYVKVDQEINLEQVRDAFKMIETVSDDYIIGEVALPELPEKAHPHVYVNKDGWIVAYYSKDEPASKIMQWIGYDGGPMTRTTLEDVIRKIYDILRLSYKDVTYYHFQYPGANRIMLVTEFVKSSGESTDSFYLTIPRRCQLYEASWAHHFGGPRDAYTWSYFAIDGTRISYLGKEGTSYGDLTNQLEINFRHTIKVTNSGYKGTIVTLILIYQE